MREALLTTHEDRFAVALLMEEMIQPFAREDLFEDLAVQWLKNAFGDDVVQLHPLRFAGGKSGATRASRGPGACAGPLCR